MPRFADEVLAEAKEHRRTLHESGKPQWAGALKDSFAWTTEIRIRIQAELTKVRLEYAERLGAWYPKAEIHLDRPPQRDHMHNLIARFTLVGGLFAMFLEALLAGFLSIIFLRMPWWAATCLGLGITFCFALLVMACIAALVLARYPDRSRATSRPLIILLSISLPIALVLMTLFFLTRGVPSGLLSMVFGWDTALLGIDLPIVAGVLLTLRGLFNWSGEYEDTYHGILNASSKVEELRSRCDRELGELGVATTQSVPGSAQRLENGADAAHDTPRSEMDGHPGPNGKSILPIIAALFVAWAAQAIDGRAEADPARTGEIWLDDTTSVDSADRIQAIQSLSEVLPRITDAHKIVAWRFFGFGDNPWSGAPFFKFEVPQWRSPECPKETATEAGQVFNSQAPDPDACKHFIERQRDAFRQAALKKYADAATVLVSHKPDSARCTNISDLLMRLSDESLARYTVVISDGIETCNRLKYPQSAAPPRANHVVFVLTETVPKLKASVVTPGARFRHQADVLTHAASWLAILPPSRIDDQILDLAPVPMSDETLPRDHSPDGGADLTAGR